MKDLEQVLSRCFFDPDSCHANERLARLGAKIPEIYVPVSGRLAGSCCAGALPACAGAAGARTQVRPCRIFCCAGSGSAVGTGDARDLLQGFGIANHLYPGCLAEFP